MEVEIVSGFRGLLLSTGVEPVPHASEGLRGDERRRYPDRWLAHGKALGYPWDHELKHDLTGKDLACWCPLDQPCHADILLKLANSDPGRTQP